MKFSVIIPCYNSASSLRDALNSVYSQDYKDFEVIVIYKPSGDNTEDILKTYPCISIENYRNVSVARNVGIERAKGEYLAFLDSDDKWYPHYLSSIATIINEYNPDVIVSRQKKIELNNEFCVTDDWGDANSNLFKMIADMSCFPNMSSLCFKRIVGENNKCITIKFNESLSYGEDLGYIMENAFYSSTCCFNKYVSGEYVCSQIHKYVRCDSPIVPYYAEKVFNCGKEYSKEALSKFIVMSSFGNLDMGKKKECRKYLKYVKGWKKPMLFVLSLLPHKLYLKIHEVYNK